MKNIAKNFVILFLFPTHFATLQQFNKSSTLPILFTKPEATRTIVVKWYRQSNIKKILPLELVELIRKDATIDEIEFISLLNNKITDINNRLDNNIPNNILYSKKRIKKISDCSYNIKRLISCFNSLNLVNNNINNYIESTPGFANPYKLDISINNINNKILSMKHQCINENTQKGEIFVSFESVQKSRSYCLIL